MVAVSARESRRTMRRAFLTLLGVLGRPFVASSRPPPPTAKLLLIRPDHLGDLLLTTPALRRLRQRWPAAHISCLVGPWAAPVVERSAHLDAVLYCDFPWFNGRPRAALWQPYAQLLATARRLRLGRFDAAVNLRFDFWWGALLACWAGIPYRVGYDVAECRPFLTAALPYQQDRHEVLQNLALVDWITGSPGAIADGTDPNDTTGPLEFPVTTEEREFARAYLLAKGVADDRPLIAIHPGTRAPVKRWSESGFAAVATSLCARLAGTAIITGSATERPIAERIARDVAAPAIVAAGETTLGQLAAVFERAAIVLGVDSGPLHLAAALGRPTVHLFGPTDDRAFGPFGNANRHVVVRADLSCAPCRRLDWPASELPAHQCMATITVAQVLQAADRVLEGSRQREA